MTTTNEATRLHDDAEPIRRDRDSLLSALARVDEEGWNGTTATLLLSYVREQIARPLALGAGLRGSAAAQAEASAWQAAWLVLTKPGLRTAESPWGVIWRAAQRAVLGEIVSAMYGRSERRAWELWAGTDGVPTKPLVGLDIWIATGGHAIGDEYLTDGASLHAAYRAAVTVLQQVGWPTGLSRRIVKTVAGLPDPGQDPRSQASGWRVMATDLGLPPWQARRLCVALLGTVDWPGLLARLLVDGPAAARTPAMQAALRSTRTRRHRSPVLAASRAEAAAAA
jgi:hypothetical protein